MKNIKDVTVPALIAVGIICATIMYMQLVRYEMKELEIETQKMRIESEQIRTVRWNTESAKRYLENVAKEQPE